MHLFRFLSKREVTLQREKQQNESGWENANIPPCALCPTHKKSKNLNSQYFEAENNSKWTLTTH